MANNKTKIVLRDLALDLDGEESTLTASVVGVMNENGQVMYTLMVLANGSLQIKAGGLASRGGIALESRLHIIPESSDRIVLSRPLAVEPK